VSAPHGRIFDAEYIASSGTPKIAAAATTY